MNKKKTQKELQSQLKTVKSEISEMNTELNRKAKEIRFKKEMAANIQKEIDKYNNPKELVVSEHAYLRYFERVKGFDLEAIKKEILSEKVLSLMEKLGPSGHFPNDGYRVVLKDNTVTTILI